LVSQVDDHTLFSPFFKSPFSNNFFFFFYPTFQQLTSLLPQFHLNSFNMHASTIAAILAFTAGMSVNAAPTVGPHVSTNAQPTGPRKSLLDNDGLLPDV